MKLLTKTSRYYLGFLAIASIFTIAILYMAIQYMVYDDVDKKLKYESQRIAFHLRDEGEIPASNYISRTEMVDRTFPESGFFRDTLIYEIYDEELIPYREYHFVSADSTGRKYRITLRNILLDTDDLAVGLFIITSVIFLILIAGLYLVNQQISSRIWAPFFNNLRKLSAFKLEEKRPIDLESSDIEEFNSLNLVVSQLIGQIEKDFLNLKEFNENVSHEMQTPLAVISNKMELLMESPDLTEQEVRLLKAAYLEVNKLSRISRSLVLIAKIENKEFTDVDVVSFRALITDILSQLEEMIQIKELTLTKVLEADPKKEADPILLNILFTNLIKNAIQHNQKRGFIRIYLGPDHFEIANSGPALQTDSERLFQRFHRDDPISKSMGLGLAIAQKICKLYELQLSYQYQDGTHLIRLHF